MKLNKLLVLTFAAALMLTGCTTSNPNTNNDGTDPSIVDDDAEIKRIYALYQANGGTLTYEEWLESIKGEDGLSLLTGHGAPAADLGKVGDSYIDLDSWDFYVKATGGWAKEGNLKTPDVETYTVQWLDYDGTLLELDENVQKGSTPAYGGVTPTREQDEKFIYTFTGWSPELAPVNSNQTYIAQYDSNAQSYTIIWKDYDGTILETDENVDYGSIPTFDQLYPTRDEEESCTYEFSGWSPSVSKVVANQTYIATYRKTTKSFLVQFVNYDGNVLQSSMMDYGSTPSFNGHNSPAKPQTAQHTYTFKGWDKELKPVTEAVTYTAVFDEAVRTYTVSWYASGYGNIKSEKLEYGSTPVAPANSEIPAKSPTTSLVYEFTGWDKAIVPVTSDITYNAVYSSSARKYTVSWRDQYGTEFKFDEIEYDSQIVSYSPSVDSNKVFKGWKTSLTSSSYVSFPYTVRSDVVFYADIINKFEFNYLPLTDSYSLAKSVGTADITTIPTSYNDGVHGEKNVTEIASGAFQNTAITSMIIPDTITQIAGKAFASCNSLTTLYIPKSVTKIMEGIILYDTNLFIYCEATSKPSAWDSYWNVTSYFMSETNHTSSKDVFNNNITWGYVR